MTVEERRRIALHRAASASWGEENADTLVELVAPSGHELATRSDVEGVLAAITAMDERLTEQMRAMDERITTQMRAMDERITTQMGAMDQRWEARSDGLRHELLGALDRRIADAVTLQTRTLVVSQLVALVVIAGLAFGLR
jgi:hypothetical protein